MSRSDDLRIADILEAAQHLSMLVAGGRQAFDGDWMRQRAVRHLLAHHYHRVDIDQIWTIVSVSVPSLTASLAPPVG